MVVALVGGRVPACRVPACRSARLPPLPEVLAPYQRAGGGVPSSVTGPCAEDVHLPVKEYEVPRYKSRCNRRMQQQTAPSDRLRN